MSNEGPAAPRRLTRSEAAARTRELLLAGAREVFLEHGYQDATIYQVAQRAGRTIGALYAHFGGKEGVFLALWDRHFAEGLEHYAGWVVEARTASEVPAAAGEFWTRFLRRDPDMFRLFIEFWSHALREPELRGRLVGSLRQLHAAITEIVGSYQRGFGLAPGVSAAQLATVCEALVDGFALHKLADPEQVDDELLGRAFGWLTQGLLAEAPSGPAERASRPAGGQGTAAPAPPSP